MPLQGNLTPTVVAFGISPLNPADTVSLSCTYMDTQNSLYLDKGQGAGYDAVIRYS